MVWYRGFVLRFCFSRSAILLHADHIIVYGLAAADVADLNVVGALCLDDLGQLLGLLVGDIAAGDERLLLKPR